MFLSCLKVSLIRGWEDITTKLSEHAGSLASMRNSPYYKVIHFDLGLALGCIACQGPSVHVRIMRSITRSIAHSDISRILCLLPGRASRLHLQMSYMHTNTSQLNTRTYTSQSKTCQVFESEASQWEDRMNRLRELLDLWVEIQRRWVYLEGIFLGSADIKHQVCLCVRAHARLCVCACMRVCVY